MNRKLPLFRLAASALLLIVGTAFADKDVLGKTKTGSPETTSIDVIRFGPGGVLFVGDGRGSQVLAVEVPGKEAKAGFKSPIEEINTKLAAKIGAPAKAIEIVDIAVHPVSHVAYVAVRKQADRKTLIMSIDGEGKIDEFALETIKYARIALNSGKGAMTKVTDLAWAGDRLLIAGAANEEFGSKIFSVMGPIAHEAKAEAFSTETYHVAHRKWETKAPMTVLMPYEEDGKKYLAGSFACTPVVKYPLDDLKAGGKVKGVSMLEMGNGNRPLNMFSYQKDGKSYVLMNVFRMFHDRAPVGPSPYWTMSFERSLLEGADKDKTNEKAPWRVDGKLKPINDKIKVVESFHGVSHMDKLDATRALTLKADGKGNMTLAAIDLP